MQETTALESVGKLACVYSDVNSVGRGVGGCIDLRKLRAKKQNLRRVVNPCQQNGYRPRRAIGGHKCTPAKIQSNTDFPDGKRAAVAQRQSKHRSMRSGVGKNLKDHAKENRRDAEGYSEVDNRPEGTVTGNKCLEKALIAAARH